MLATQVCFLNMLRSQHHFLLCHCLRQFAEQRSPHNLHYRHYGYADAFEVLVSVQFTEATLKSMVRFNGGAICFACLADTTAANCHGFEAFYFSCALIAVHCVCVGGGYCNVVPLAHCHQLAPVSSLHDISV